MRIGRTVGRPPLNHFGNLSSKCYKHKLCNATVKANNGLNTKCKDLYIGRQLEAKENTQKD